MAMTNTHWLDTKNCAWCGKEFTIPDINSWVFKIGNVYYCRYSCKRSAEKKAEESKMSRAKSSSQFRITQEIKDNAVQMAIEGKSPLSYLQQCGSGNPSAMWYTIKTALKRSDPGLYAQIPARLDQKGQEETPVVKVDGPIRIETPEAKKVEVVETPEAPTGIKPLSRDGFEVCCVKHYAYGELYRDDKHNCIDWRTPGGDEVTISLDAWKMFAKDLPRALQILGVDA